MPPVPRIILRLTLALSLLAGLSAIAGAGFALAPLLGSDQRPAWILFGFELVVIVAAVIGVLFGRGRFGEAPALALTCIAGTLAVASVLGWQAAGRQINGHSLTPLMEARVLGAGLLAASAAWCVLSRNPRSWRMAALGAALGVPVVIVAAAVAVPSGRSAITSVTGTSPGALAAAAVLGLLVVGGLFSASAHLIIRAFELGRPEERAGAGVGGGGASSTSSRPA